MKEIAALILVCLILPILLWIWPAAILYNWLVCSLLPNGFEFALLVVSFVNVVLIMRKKR